MKFGFPSCWFANAHFLKVLLPAAGGGLCSPGVRWPPWKVAAASSLLASGAQSTPWPQHVGIAVDLAMIWCSGVVAGSLSALEVKFTDSNCQQM